MMTHEDATHRIACCWQEIAILQDDIRWAHMDGLEPDIPDMQERIRQYREEIRTLRATIS